MKRVRFLMIGGFLGAGKTTMIARLARHYMALGKNVGLVTNDQAYDLVDTHALRAQGFRVGEVPGACFCCKFDQLLETAAKLHQDQVPDLIIAEPVGSCTDLVATVIEPMRHLYGDQYELGPLAVLLKPEHGQKILRDQQGVGFSPKAAYIFLKQIEEADIVVIHKIDKLSRPQRIELLDLISRRFAEKDVVAASARSGEGMTKLIDALGRTKDPAQVMMNVNYDTYAEGEAELAWLNCRVRVENERAERFSLDELLLQVVTGLRDVLAETGAETVHLKVMGQVGSTAGVANLVESTADVELSLESAVESHQADLIINARVATDPERLEGVVTRVVVDVADRWNLRQSICGLQRFRPARPVPTHRITTEAPRH